AVRFVPGHAIKILSWLARAWKFRRTIDVRWEKIRRTQARFKSSVMFERSNAPRSVESGQGSHSLNICFLNTRALSLAGYGVCVPRHDSRVVQGLFARRNPGDSPRQHFAR